MRPVQHSLWGSLDADHVVALGESSRTFADLCADVQHISTLLPTASGNKEQRSEVLIACADRYRFAVAIFASWIKGHAVALPPTHRHDALVEIAQGGHVVETIHDGEAPMGFDLRDLLTSNAPETLPFFPTLDADLHIATLYTSGSTGAPLRVQKRAAQLLGEVDALAETVGAEVRSVLCSVPPRHIYGLLFGLLLPLRTLGSFVRETPLHTDTLLDLLRRYSIDTLVAVPAHLLGVAGTTREMLVPLQRVFSSGAPLPDATFDALTDRLGLSVAEVLGSTETGGIAYRRSAHDPFQSFPNVTIEATKEGQLLLRSPYLSSDVPQPHACPDRIELVSPQTFLHLGRADDIVKVAGARISLGAIEERVRTLPGIVEAAAIARDVPGARGQEILLVAVGDGWNATRMRETLAASLDPIAIPRRYRFVTELPREPTGKLRRDALLQLFDGSTEGGFERMQAVRDQERARIVIRVPKDLLCLRGHFEQWPVLPGVAQLGLLAVQEAQASWPELRVLRRAKRVKFKRPIAPEQTLTLNLLRSENRVDFSIERDGELCSSGSLYFDTEASR